MSLRFTPAKAYANAPVRSPIAKALAARAIGRFANDNGSDFKGSTGPIQAENDQILRAALRHFAQHGLSAASEARSQAEAAFFAGDRQAYDWWLGITRTLDRRLAQETELFSPETAHH